MIFILLGTTASTGAATTQRSPLLETEEEKLRKLDTDKDGINDFEGRSVTFTKWVQWLIPILSWLLFYTSDFKGCGKRLQIVFSP